MNDFIGKLMRILIHFLSSTFLLVTGTCVTADETYLTASGDEVSRLESFQECITCPEMIVLPLGEFQMGSSVAEANAARIRFFIRNNADPSNYEVAIRQSFINLNIDPDHPEEGLRAYYASENYVRENDPQYNANQFLHEAPRHQVLIDMPIAIGRNEVTREEWAACVTDGACEQGLKALPNEVDYLACLHDAKCEATPDSRLKFSLRGIPHTLHPRDPMTAITYSEMLEYTSWLNGKVGSNVYRIPTEAEWEYAARAGTTTPFAQGNELTLGQANFKIVQVDVNGETIPDRVRGGGRELVQVDTLDAANAWGLRHMSGNASEFTSTCGEGPHRSLASSSKYLAADADRRNCSRSLKGGMYFTNMELARPARRVPMNGDNWSVHRGFRVVRDLASDLNPND